MRQPGELEQLGEQFSMAFGIHAAQPGIQAHVLHDRKVLIQAEALRHVASGGMDGIVVCDHVETGHGDMACIGLEQAGHRSEEHTSELQSLMRISYAVFCLKKQKE